VTRREHRPIVADDGSDWSVSGAPNAGWDDDQPATLRGVRGRDLEVVDASSLEP
jgi:hypothetical protein